MEELKSSSSDGEGVKAVSRFGAGWGLHVNCEREWGKGNSLGIVWSHHCKCTVKLIPEPIFTCTCRLPRDLTVLAQAPRLRIDCAIARPQCQYK
jgi:hypothetical protein